MTSFARARRPSQRATATSLRRNTQRGGPVSQNPNAVRGKGSHLDAQKKALDHSVEPTEVSDKTQPSGKKPTTFIGKSGMVHTDSGTLALRKGPDEKAAVLAQLPLGSPLEATVAEGIWLKVTAWPGGTATEGYVHSGFVKEQPGLDRPDHDTDTDDRPWVTYKKLEGKAFQGDPEITDVKQGGLGDCYLMTSLGAMANTTGGKKQLKDMVAPHGKASKYTVRFKKKADGKTTTVKKTVDTWFPSEKGGFRYALRKSKVPMKDRALWPAIIEKAYASWKGSYDDIEGGAADEAIAEMTGLSSKETPLSDIPKDADLLTVIKAALARGEAVTASSLYNAPKNLNGRMGGKGLGPYTATGDAAKVTAKSVRIWDGNKAPSAPGVADDGEGKLHSAPAGTDKKRATGKVNYAKSSFSVTYPKGAAPASPTDLNLTYKAYGRISNSPVVYGRHAYVIKAMKGDKLDLHNPWNSTHPGAVDIATFRKLFRKFTNSVMPDGTVK